MSVVLVVVLGVLIVVQVHLKTGHDRHDVPLHLEQGIALSGTQRSERHYRVLDLLAILVERCVDESIVLEDLFDLNH